MAKIYVEGPVRLSGEVDIHGAKNGALPILAGTILCRGECVLHNCPNLSDVETSLKILTHLGCFCRREGETVIVNATDMNGYEIPDALMREMRSSIVFLGAIVARMGRAKLSSPGGCELGPRPIDLHLSALRSLGASISEDHGVLDCTTPALLNGAAISLSFPSVGATENIMLASATARGVTVIHNAAREPEISDLADFLNSAGAKIYGAGSDTIEIHGVAALHGTEHTVLPDRIAAATFLAAAAITRGSVVLHKVMPSHLMSVLSVFREAGCDVVPSGKDLKLSAPAKLRRIPTVRTLVYPGFPTDAGPPIVAMQTLADGTSMFLENIFESRFKYVDELKRLGANIKVAGKVAVVEGVARLSGASVECTDLRGGAALVVAALAAWGETEIDKIYHIDRGYDRFEENLCALGAKIKRE